MPKKRGRGANANGRSKKDRYIGISHYFYDSTAFQTLPPAARCIYLELKRRYNGSNNGEIRLSCREAAEVIHGSTATASRMLVLLQDHGLIKCHNKGVYQNRHATTWILTSEVFEERAPTNEWRDFKLEEKF